MATSFVAPAVEKTCGIIHPPDPSWRKAILIAILQAPSVLNTFEDVCTRYGRSECSIMVFVADLAMNGWDIEVLSQFAFRASKGEDKFSAENKRFRREGDTQYLWGVYRRSS